MRYAPSPTGWQHIGGARTALFNYFFTRVHGGKFILRIEDTDQTRFLPEALDDLYETMDWLGIEWDEGPGREGGFGPYVQSERSALYQKYARQLVESGKAYYCYCTPARLERIRKIQEQNGLPPGYDRHCRNLTEAELAEAEGSGVRPVVRLKVPLDQIITVEDELLGKSQWESKAISPDPVLLKSDGLPTYHLANIVDDHLMEITHVMRAQEWLPSAPLHKILYEAFGWQMPKICHLPMVMGNDGHKLSKRHGATAVKDFRAQGYLPEAIVNYISLLGWSYDDSREFFTMQELCRLFNLQRLNKAPAVFDYKKLDWFNGMYIRKLDMADLKARLIPFLHLNGLIGQKPSPQQDKLLDEAMPLIQERMQRLTDAGALLGFFFKAPQEYSLEDAIPKKMDKEAVLEALAAAKTLMEGFDRRSDEENEALFRQQADKAGLKINQLLQPVRVAATGSKVSPPLFGSLRLLGGEEAIRRIDALRAFLKGD